MKKRRDETTIKYFDKYLRVQDIILRWLRKGTKIPWAFREYGEHYEEYLYQEGYEYRIGSEGEPGGKLFRKMKDPTPEEMIELNYAWDNRSIFTTKEER